MDKTGKDRALTGKTERTSFIKATAQKLGFSFCGVSRAEFLEEEAPRLEAWLKNHYQGKMDATATFSISDDWLNMEILKPLEMKESIVVICEVRIHDEAGNHLTTGKVHWQIKDWKRVRTKA